MEVLKMSVAVSAMVLATACVKSESVNKTDEARISVEAGIEGLTRTPNLDENGAGNFANGDELVLTVTGNGTTVQKDYAIGTSFFWNDLQLPEGTTTATFAGCYPKPSNISGHKFTFDLSTASYKDLLLAPGVEVSKSASTRVQLQFKHAMHKLVVKYTSKTYTDEDLKQAQTTCVAKPSCEVDMQKATVVASTASSTSEFVETGANVALLLVPQSTQDVTLKITVAGNTFQHKLADLNTVLKNPTVSQVPANLESGKSLTLKLELNKDGIVVDGSQIGGWEDQGTIGGEIGM